MKDTQNRTDRLVEFVGKVVDEPTIRTRYDRMTNQDIAYFAKFTIEVPTNAMHIDGVGNQIASGRWISIRALGEAAELVKDVSKGDTVKVVGVPTVEFYVRLDEVEVVDTPVVPTNNAMNAMESSLTGDSEQPKAVLGPAKASLLIDDDDVDVMDPFAV